MEKVTIKLEYEDKLYCSQKAEMNDKEIEQLKEFITKVSEGKITYLTFENKGFKYFFTSKILEKSILTIEID